MEADATPSRAERAYAAVITVVVPVFFAAIWVSCYIRNGAVDVALMKCETINFLAYIDTNSFALWFGTTLGPRLTLSLQSELLRSSAGFGLPLFVLTTCFNWAFPSHIRFAEHIGFNLMLALL